MAVLIPAPVHDRIPFTDYGTLILPAGNKMRIVFFCLKIDP